MLQFGFLKSEDSETLHEAWLAGTASEMKLLFYYLV